jgi:glycosyltransferase involved in cell wall biosynthesis
MINYSFIIPHHNCPKLLNRLLDSIPQREDIEIIVVDDNSDEDKKPKVARSDVSVVLIPKEESKGAGHARNIGLDMAKGKWLLFADSDDYYEKDFISNLDEHINSDADIVFFSAYVNYDIEHPQVNQEQNYIELIFQNYLESSKTELDIRRAAMAANVPWNKMFKKQFIFDIGAWFEEIPISNDAWFVKYAGSKAAKIEIIKKRLYYYIKYPNNTTNKKRPLNHYYLAIDSNTRRNVLLRDVGLFDMIEFPGFNKENILRDFGKWTFVKLILYKLFHDPTFFKSIIKKLRR